MSEHAPLEPGRYRVSITHLEVTQDDAFLMLTVVGRAVTFAIEVPALAPHWSQEVHEAREKAAAYLAVAFPAEDVQPSTMAEFFDAMESGHHGVSIWRNVFWSDLEDDINRWAISNAFEEWRARGGRQ